MGRSGNPRKRVARQMSAAARQGTGGATPAQEMTEVVPDITKVSSRAHKKLPDQAPDHLCDDPVRCIYKGTWNDCFWTTPDVVFNKDPDITKVQKIAA